MNKDGPSHHDYAARLKHDDDDDDDYDDDFAGDVAMAMPGPNVASYRFDPRSPSILNNFKTDEEGFIILKTAEGDDTVEVAEPAAAVAAAPLEPLEPPPVADVVSHPELLSLLINELRTIAMASGNYLSITNMNDTIHYE